MRFAALDIGVGQFVDYHDFRAGVYHCGPVELFQLLALAEKLSARKRGNAHGHSLGFGAAVGFNICYFDVGTGGEQFAGLLKHAVGFAHARYHGSFGCIPRLVKP